MTWEKTPGGILVPVVKPRQSPDPLERAGAEVEPAPMPEQCECGAAWATIGEDVCETCVGYNGHDDNCATRTLLCAAGHKRKISVRRTCATTHYDDIDHRGEAHAACDWKGKASCWCHHYLKLDAWPELAIKPSEYGEPVKGSPLRYMDGI